MGLIGRQQRASESALSEPIDPVHHGVFIGRSLSRSSSRSVSLENSNPNASLSPGSTPYVTPEISWPANQGYFNIPSGAIPTKLSETGRRVSSNPSRPTPDSFHSEGLFSNFSNLSIGESRKPHDDEVMSTDSGSTSSVSGHHHSLSQISNQVMPPPPMALLDRTGNARRFVGTPDYLAPEVITGNGQDDMADWWSMGCIFFEFLFEYPPFNADTPEQVFDNILNRKIHWPDDPDSLISASAKDLINALICLDPSQRPGVDNIKAHLFFNEIDWNHIFDHEAPFKPNLDHPEDTDYFDQRGCAQFFNDELQDLSDSPEVAESTNQQFSDLSKVRSDSGRSIMPLAIPPHVREHKRRDRRLSEPFGSGMHDFGSFVFKNLPVLEKANKDIIQRLKSEHSGPSQGYSPDKPRQRSAPSPWHFSPSSSVGSPAPTPSSPLTPQLTVSTTTSFVRSGSQSSTGSNPAGFSSPVRRRPSILLPSAINEDSNMLDDMSPIKPTSSVPQKHDIISFDTPIRSRPQRRNTMPSRPRAKSAILGQPAFRVQQERKSQVFEERSSSDNEEVRDRTRLSASKPHSRRLSQLSVQSSNSPSYHPLKILRKILAGQLS